MIPPLRFEPIAKARPWGADRLARFGKPTIDGSPVGETWEVADLPDAIAGGQSMVAEGPLAGRTLRSIRLDRREELLGIATPAPDGSFPLLAKFLDARENLSLQVHPDAAYERLHPEARLKTEAWIVVEAEPGACVYRGLRPSTTREEFARALDEGRALDHVVSYEVRRGDCVYLPSGTCHALGGGILAVEIQTPSDTTFRVWDWNRNAPSRPLHREQSFASLHFGAAQEDGTRGFVRLEDAPLAGSTAMSIRRLCRSPFFSIEWREAREPIALPIGPSGIPEIWTSLAGTLRVRTASSAIALPPGATILLPAQVEEGSVECPEGSVHLRTVCASPLDRAT